MTPAPHIHGLLLAAGRSSRMGPRNKLLETLGGRPIVRIAAEAVIASRCRAVTVVTGHQSEDVRAALAGLRAEFVHNPDYADGLAGSLAAGLAVAIGLAAAIGGPGSPLGLVACAVLLVGAGAGLAAPDPAPPLPKRPLRRPPLPMLGGRISRTGSTADARGCSKGSAIGSMKLTTGAATSTTGSRMGAAASTAFMT